MGGGTIAGFFTECSGIGSESEVTDHKAVDSGGKPFVQKEPGRMKWTDVSLKRGITNTMDVWDWRQQVVEGKIKDARKNCSIIMYSLDGTAVARWDFVNAWPSKVTGPSLKADSNDLGVEEMTIVHEGMTRVKV